LEKRLPVLTSGAQDAPARQQTLRNAIAWSYDLLSPKEQTLFQRLAVFGGGASMAAMETVANPDGDLEVFGELERLLEHNLLRQEEQPGGEPRFLMLETIREFGLERLAAHDDLETTRDRHTAYFHDLAQRTEPDLVVGRFAGGSFARLDDERDNLRAALAWWLERGAVGRALTLAGALAEY
jgi:predicted ATPase